MMQEQCSQQFEEAIQKLDWVPGSLIHARVLDIGKDFVTLDAQLKSEGLVPTTEFRDPDGSLSLQVGDEVQVVLEFVENGYGETVLSREKAKRLELWKQLEAAYETGALVAGVINGRVKGGFTVELGEIRAFLPGSLVDVRPLKDASHLEGKPLEFKVLKLDQRRNNVVVSRRAALASDQSEEREKLLARLQEGMVVKGVVKNLTDYGAFVDLGGVDGLLHITDMAWKRVRHPSEIANVGDELQVKVLKFDAEKVRVSLGLKQLQPDPWDNIYEHYHKGERVRGKVSNFTDYGCFVTLDSGIEGLVHVSEMGWVNKNQHPSKICQLGEEVEVMILEINHERRRISLGLKQCRENPWKKFAETYERGALVSGVIHSMTDFGIFLRLEGGIDGLIHLSDLTWEVAPEEALKRYQKGQTLEAMVLQVDLNRERISLGLKQLTTSPVEQYFQSHPEGSCVKATLQALEGPHKGMALLSLEEQVTGEIAAEALSALYPELQVGQSVDLWVRGLSFQGQKSTPVLALSAQEAVSTPTKRGSSSASPSPAAKPEQPESALAEAFRLAKWRESESS